ncbi:MAG: hypothetical protein J6Z14_02525 [Prevotella sp.]|nr:hypothetical protein [Prevotella sp.]
MKKHLLVALALLLFGPAAGLAQKRVYIPEDLRGMNLESDTSKWCWRRSAETRDLIFMWERGFGNDLQNPPQLEGRAMAFNLSVLMERVQSFYTFFRDTLGFANKPVSKADRYKMMVMVMYSLEGTAYGGTYDNYIGALWVAPNRIQDKTMNCMAHELGHSFQSQIMADSVGQCWGGTGFFEMASQWMLWQVNPWWLRDENYHFEAFKTLTHKAFLSLDNIYHSPYVLQWWSDLHGRKCIADLFRQGRIGEDPVVTYKRVYGLSQEDFCQEMLRGYQHLVNLDFNHARTETRPYACTWQTPLDTLRGGWFRPKNTLEDYGFHIIPLPGGKTSGVKVKGKDLRWALVGVTPDGQAVYGKPQQSRLPAVSSGYAHRFVVVMAAPATHEMLPRPHRSEPPKQRLYPYDIKF